MAFKARLGKVECVITSQRLHSGSNGRKAVQVQVLLPAPEKSTSSEVLFSMKRTLRRMKNEAGLRPMKRGFAARRKNGVHFA